MSETDARGLPIASLWEAFSSTRTSCEFDEKGVREHVEQATKCHLASSQHQRSRQVVLMLNTKVGQADGYGADVIHTCRAKQWLKHRSRMTFTLRSALPLEQLQTAHIPDSPRHGYGQRRYTALPRVPAQPPSFSVKLHRWKLAAFQQKALVDFSFENYIWRLLLLCRIKLYIYKPCTNMNKHRQSLSISFIWICQP